MPEQTIDTEITEKITKHHESIETIEKIENILGGGLTGRPGLMQSVGKMAEDMYGPNNGILARMSKLEDTQKSAESYAKGWMKGVAMVCAFAGGLIVWLLGKLFK